MKNCTNCFLIQVDGDKIKIQVANIALNKNAKSSHCTKYSHEEHIFRKVKICLQNVKCQITLLKALLCF